jgi:histone H2A
MSKKSGLMMAAILEYLCAEIIETAGSMASSKGKKRINNRHLSLAINTDDEM